MLLIFFTGIGFVRCYWSRIYRGLLSHGSDSVRLDAPILRHTEQASPRHIQVSQSAQYEQSVNIPGQATVTHLDKAEHTLDQG